MTQLQQLLLQLDTNLVAKPLRDSGWPGCIPETAHDLMGGVMYLSDHGLSRIGLSDETGRIFLTYNSTDKVRAAWEQQGELVGQINQLCQAELHEYELFT